MWRTAFLVAWFGCIGVVGTRWQPWPATFSDREAGLLVLSLLIAVLPWATGPGLLALLRRMPSGGVNLPHASYWFSGARRSASLDRMAPFLDAMALALTLFLTGILALNATPNAAGLEAQVLTGTALFVVWGGVWTWQLARAFPEPPIEPVKPRGKP